MKNYVKKKKSQRLRSSLVLKCACHFEIFSKAHTIRVTINLPGIYSLDANDFFFPCTLHDLTIIATQIASHKKDMEMGVPAEQVISKSIQLKNVIASLNRHLFFIFNKLYLCSTRIIKKYV